MTSIVWKESGPVIKIPWPRRLLDISHAAQAQARQGLILSGADESKISHNRNIDSLMWCF